MTEERKLGPLQKIIRYYIEILQLRLVERLTEEATEILTQGQAAGFWAHPKPWIPLSLPVERFQFWREQEDVLVGWPLVSLGDHSYAPLFMSPSSLMMVDNMQMFGPRGGDISLNLYALTVLGLSRVQRTELVAMYQTDFGWNVVDRMNEVIAWLQSKKYLKGDLNPRHLSFNKKAKVNNGAILISGSETFGVQSLLAELIALADMDESQLQNGLLAQAFALHKPQRLDFTPCFSSFSPLNLQQQLAVDLSRKRSLSVVTGPPGTGKSQVVINAAIAAVLSGERVLIAAQNNQAVDVVFQRIQEADSLFFPLRIGKKSLREDLVVNLNKWLSLKRTPTAIKRNEHLEDKFLKFMTRRQQSRHHCRP